ncbi:hypothetical protein COCON_G00144840 [Conger conger]|uniref:Uncharacterized protein n=1 Tax=Conger conger TaxID=82655 RepID=A0A9Q1HVZ7_CONCO|nr:hypothetical protein COCON_G00144840 [Conger conger]
MRIGRDHCCIEITHYLPLEGAGLLAATAWSGVQENGRPGRSSAERNSPGLGESGIYRSYHEQYQENCRFFEFVRYVLQVSPGDFE